MSTWTKRPSRPSVRTGRLISFTAGEAEELAFEVDWRATRFQDQLTLQFSRDGKNFSNVPAQLIRGPIDGQMRAIVPASLAGKSAVFVLRRTFPDKEE